MLEDLNKRPSRNTCLTARAFWHITGWRQHIRYLSRWSLILPSSSLYANTSTDTRTSTRINNHMTLNPGSQWISRVVRPVTASPTFPTWSQDVNKTKQAPSGQRRKHRNVKSHQTGRRSCSCDAGDSRGRSSGRCYLRNPQGHQARR